MSKFVYGGWIVQRNNININTNLWILSSTEQSFLLSLSLPIIYPMGLGILRCFVRVYRRVNEKRIVLFFVCYTCLWFCIFSSFLSCTPYIQYLLLFVLYTDVGLYVCTLFSIILVLVIVYMSTLVFYVFFLCTYSYCVVVIHLHIINSLVFCCYCIFIICSMEPSILQLST